MWLMEVRVRAMIRFVFNIVFEVLAPHVQIVAPVRELELSRQQED